MPPVGNTLDALLPLLQPHQRELHLNASVVEVAEPSQLAELAADPRIRRQGLLLRQGRGQVGRGRRPDRRLRI